MAQSQEKNQQQSYKALTIKYRGISAQEIRKRFAPEVIKRLLELQWWNWPEEKIRKAIGAIRNGETEPLENI